VEASIATAVGSQSQWEVPNAAITRIAGKSALFVATPTGFRSQPVEVLSEGAQSSVISGMLKGDEKIAIGGVSSLKASSMGIGGGE
jgi:membrane fusion protein, heavy metal efflux system